MLPDLKFESLRYQIVVFLRPQALPPPEPHVPVSPRPCAGAGEPQVPHPGARAGKPQVPRQVRLAPGHAHLLAQDRLAPGPAQPHLLGIEKKLQAGIESEVIREDTTSKN